MSLQEPLSGGHLLKGFRGRRSPLDWLAQSCQLELGDRVCFVPRCPRAEPGFRGRRSHLDWLARSGRLGQCLKTLDWLDAADCCCGLLLQDEWQGAKNGVSGMLLLCYRKLL